MIKCIAGIVSYNPDIQKLKDAIYSIAYQVHEVVVVDNGSNNVDEICAVIAQLQENITLIKNIKNLGIAAALNQIMTFARDNGYDWAITLDQDSICPNNLIDVQGCYIDENVAVIAPYIEYKGNEEYYHNDHKVHEVSWVITSASLTNVHVWSEIDGFDEALFIDGVDEDFCIRAGIRGYKIIKNNNAVIIHELGNLRCKKILGKTIHITNHNPKRIYYMVRNCIYLDKKLRTNRSLEETIKIIIKVILFEDNKIAKLHNIYLAIIDGYRMQKRASSFS